MIENLAVNHNFIRLRFAQHCFQPVTHFRFITHQRHAQRLLYAIGYAGLAATIWAAIVPALLARKSRKRFGSPKFRVWGGKPMIALILVFGAGNALVHVLSSFNLLPVYQ